MDRIIETIYRGLTALESHPSLPWVERSQTQHSVRGIATMTTFVLLFIGCALLFEDRRRRMALARGLLLRHRFLRQPFYRSVASIGRMNIARP